MIVSIWGNAGSGKSTFAIKLANSFVRLRKNVILVDANYVAPQTNIWYPNINLKKDQSLAVLLDNEIQSAEMVISKITKISSRLGIVGYAKDYAVNMMSSRQDTANAFLTTADDPEICDVIIVDCSTNPLSDIMSFVALNDFPSAERLIALSPDLRGLSWYDANVKMMEESWNNEGISYTRILNQTHITSPTADMENAIGKVSYYLPYDNEIRKELLTGTLGTEAHRTAARKYTRVVDSIANDILRKHEQ